MAEPEPGPAPFPSYTFLDGKRHHRKGKRRNLTVAINSCYLFGLINKNNFITTRPPVE